MMSSPGIRLSLDWYSTWVVFPRLATGETRLSLVAYCPGSKVSKAIPAYISFPQFKYNAGQCVFPSCSPPALLVLLAGTDGNRSSHHVEGRRYGEAGQDKRGWLAFPNPQFIKVQP